MKKSTLIKTALLTGDNHGFILSEVLLAGAILSIALASTVIIIGSLQSMTIDVSQNFEATLLAQEQMTQAHLLAFDDLASLSKIGMTTDGIFTTNFSVSYRNALTADVSVDVSWSQGQIKKHQIFTDRVVDWQNAEGAVDCDWLDSVAGNLSPINFGSLNADINNPITDISVQGDYAYVSANGTTASLPDLYVVDIHNINNPQIVGRLNTGPGIAALVAVGNYIFVANAGSYQMQIIDITNPMAPKLISQAKLPGVVVSGGAGYGQSIVYFDHKIYIGLVKANGPEFHIIDVSNPQAPIALGAYEIGSTVNSLAVEENRVLVGTPGLQSLILLDVSNPANIKTIGQVTLSGWQTQGVSSVTMLGSQVYVGRSLGGFFSPNPEFLNLNRDDVAKSVVNSISSLPIGASVDDLLAYGDYVYLATSDTSKAFEVVRNVVNGQISGAPSVTMTAALASRAASLTCNRHAMYVVTQDPQDFFHIFSLQAPLPP